MRLLEFLGGSEAGDGAWRFGLGRRLYGAFGGVNGGVLAALSLVAARPLAPGRVPTALDARFVRGLAGEARARPTLLHAGRTLACVSVDVLDERDRLCTRSTLSFVTPEALEPLDHDGHAGAPVGWTDWAGGRPWAGASDIPLVATFAPRVVGSGPKGLATALRLPFQDPEALAEAACIAADVSVGPPVGSVARGLAIPNPDLSLRFCGEAPLSDVIVGAARLERIGAGLATTRIEVWSGGRLAAVGVSSTTLLRSG